MTKPNYSLTVRKRLWPLFVSGFLQNLIFWYGIEKLFMIQIGFNTETIAIETATFTFIMVLSNIPLGVIADMWSRKAMLIIASLCLVVCCLVCGASHSVAIYIVGIAFWGIFYAAITGLFDTLIYDSLLEETGAADSFNHYYGRLQAFISVALVLSSLAGGVIAKVWGTRVDYFVSIPIVLLACLPLVFFREPVLHKRIVVNNYLQRVKNLTTQLRTDRRVLLVATSLSLAIVNQRLLAEFSPIWWVALSLPVVAFGFITALLQLGYGFSGLFASFLGKRESIVWLAALCSLLSPVLFIRHTWIVLPAQLLILTVVAVLNILLLKLFHDNISSHERATGSSLVSTAGYTLFLPIALIFGVVGKGNVFLGSWVVVLLSVSILATTLLSQRLQHNEVQAN